MSWNDHKPLDVESLTLRSLSNSSIRHGTHIQNTCIWLHHMRMDIKYLYGHQPTKKTTTHFNEQRWWFQPTAWELTSTPSNCWRWVVRLVETAHAIHDQGGWKPRQCWKMGETIKNIHEHPYKKKKTKHATNVIPQAMAIERYRYIMIHSAWFFQNCLF